MHGDVQYKKNMNFIIFTAGKWQFRYVSGLNQHGNAINKIKILNWIFI